MYLNKKLPLYNLKSINISCFTFNKRSPGYIPLSDLNVCTYYACVVHLNNNHIWDFLNRMIDTTKDRHNNLQKWR